MPSSSPLSLRSRGPTPGGTGARRPPEGAPTRPAAPRWRGRALALLAAVALHWCVLSGLGLPMPAPRTVAPQAMVSRWLDDPAAVADEIGDAMGDALGDAISAVIGDGASDGDADENADEASDAPGDEAGQANSDDAGNESGSQSPNESRSDIGTRSGSVLGIPTPITRFPLHGQGELRFRFTWESQQGEATLRWRFTDHRYALTLERTAGARSFPTWHSEGTVGRHGLMPERHVVQRGTRVRELLLFEHHPHGVRLRVAGSTHEAPPGTQDRLSWWFQLAGLMAGTPNPAPGRRLALPVAGASGTDLWLFQIDKRTGNLWSLHRAVPRSAGRPALRWEVQLDAAQRFLPVDLRFSVDGTPQWALRLLEQDIQQPSTGPGP